MNAGEIKLLGQEFDDWGETCQKKEEVNFRDPVWIICIPVKSSNFRPLPQKQMKSVHPSTSLCLSMTRLQAFISAKNTATDSAVFRSGRVRIVHPAAVVSKSSAFFGLFGHHQTTGQPQAPPSANRFPQSAKKKNNNPLPVTGIWSQLWPPFRSLDKMWKISHFSPISEIFGLFVFFASQC